jgi:hypothetical protein
VPACSGSRRGVGPARAAQLVLSFYLKLHLRSIDELATVLDRFLAYGETTTSIINTSPIPRREPPVLDTT